MSLNPPLRDWRGMRVWLVGASSGIGRATASLLHARGARVIVSARNAEALAQFVREHPGAEACAVDALQGDALRDAFASLTTREPLQGFVWCVGHYHPMQARSIDLPDMLRHMLANYLGCLHLLPSVVPHLLAQRGVGPGAAPFISLVGSVAGYRGLPQSLAYGPTKAALINLAENLYLDLHDQGVAVHIINPGFVATPLTQHNTFEMPALITPEQAAVEILEGWRRGSFEIHFPKRFTRWMKLLAMLPYRWYFFCVRRVTGL